jgi:uncharacterized protein YdhG (YjbR/CyaY superfamily)
MAVTPAEKPGGKGEEQVRAAIAAMPEADRVIAERLHELVKAHAPGLTAKLWYGMPAYARNGKVVCFFQSAAKFTTRYATFGFQEEARLDDGDLWPTAFGVKRLTPDVEARIVELLKKAVG